MPPTVTRNLIIINIVVFLAESQLGDSFVKNFALWPFGTPQSLESPLGFQPWQIVTYSFLHGGWDHIFFNMFALFMFGGQVELLVGAKRYFNLYFASVITAALAQLIVAALTGGNYPTLGASGGVFGLLLAYGYYFPNRMVMLVIPPIPMRARTLVILYGLLELFLGATGTQAGVAHFAHLGGMLGAWLVIKYWRGGGGPFRRA